MAVEVLLYIEENLDDETRHNLIEELSKECGGSKPHFDTKNPHHIFVSYDEKKILPHNIPAIAKKHGVHVKIVG